MKAIKILSISLLCCLCILFFHFNLQNLKFLELKRRRVERFKEERENIKKLSHSFNKSNVIEKNIGALLDEIEQNSNNAEKVKVSLATFYKNFESTSPAKYNPMHLWYFDRNFREVRWDEKPVKSIEPVKELMQWFQSRTGLDELRKMGRLKFLLGEKFPFRSARDKANNFISMDYQGRGIHMLYWSRIIDRSKRPGILRADKGIKAGEITGYFLCIIDWQIFAPDLILRLGIINHNRGKEKPVFAYFSSQEGLRESIFPHIEGDYINILEKNWNNLGKRAQNIYSGDRFITTIPIHSEAKTWNYKKLKNLYGFKRINKICEKYLVKVSSLKSTRKEIEKYFHILENLVYLVLLCIFLLLIYLVYARFIGIKLKLILTIALFIGIPFLFYFFYEILSINAGKTKQMQEKKKELSNRLARLEKELSEEKHYLLKLCRSLRDERDYSKISETAKVKLAEELKDIKAFENILVYNKNFEAVFIYTRGKLGEKNENKSIKNLVLSVWPYLVKSNTAVKDKFVSQFTAQLFQSFSGKNVFKMLEQIDDLSEVQFGKEVLTIYLDVVRDAQNSLKYMILVVTKESKFILDILKSRAFESHINQNTYKQYFFEPGRSHLTPASVPAKWFRAFKNLCKEKFTGTLDENFDADHLIALRYIDKFGIMLGMSYPKKIIIRELEELQTGLFRNLILLFLLLLMGVLLVSSQILNPLHKIKEAMNAVDTQNFDFNLQIKTRDEISELARTFNKMLIGLAEREQFATQNAILALKEKKTKTELEIAREIQNLLYPKKMPRIPGYELYGRCLSADAIGGDYYDFVSVDDNKLAIIMADVSGHGISAALLMAMAKSGTLLGLSRDLSPSELLHSLNELVFETMQRKRMITFFTACLDIKMHKIDYANAGHVFPILLRNGKTSFLRSVSYPLGIRSKGRYQALSQTLECGDIVCFYTDGIVETMNPEEQAFGYKNLQKFILKNMDKDAKTMVELFFPELESYALGVPFTDDITLSILKRI
ncbi:SpoIIE family protein phosphatase [Candidatus Riflebacteria bacterium]